MGTYKAQEGERGYGRLEEWPVWPVSVRQGPVLEELWVSMATSAAWRGFSPPRLGTKVSMSQYHCDWINQMLLYLSLTRKLPSHVYFVHRNRNPGSHLHFICVSLDPHVYHLSYFHEVSTGFYESYCDFKLLMSAYSLVLPWCLFAMLK